MSLYFIVGALLVDMSQKRKPKDVQKTELMQLKARLETEKKKNKDDQ